MNALISIFSAVVIGVMANFLFDIFKRSLQQLCGSKISVKLPSGVIYDIPGDAKDSKEFEQTIRSLLNLTGPSSQMHMGDVNLVEDVVIPGFKKLRESAKGADIRLEYSCPSNLPRLCGDKSALQLVLFNVIENAMKYSPKNSAVRVKIDRHNDLLELQISNQNNLQVKSEAMKNIFNLYSRGKTDIQDKSGMGIGLYFVRQLIRAHGGEIYATSTPEISVTKIEIPITPPQRI